MYDQRQASKVYFNEVIVIVVKNYLIEVRFEGLVLIVYCQKRKII